jgi:hypothetical protein
LKFLNARTGFLAGPKIFSRFVVAQKVIFIWL